MKVLSSDNDISYLYSDIENPVASQVLKLAVTEDVTNLKGVIVHTQPEEEPVNKYSIIEDKRVPLTSVVDLQTSLGPLLAQMLDGLKIRDLTGGNKRKLSSEVKTVKGILTTGQHSLFFSLQSGNPLPVLEFHGKFTVKVFDKETGRQRGLDLSERLEPADIERYLKNLYYFIVHTV
jgi:hypothetical protein